MPPPYEVTLYQDASFSYVDPATGQAVDVSAKAGTMLAPIDDPCTLLALVSAAVDAGVIPRGNPQTIEVLAEVGRDCQAAAGTGAGIPGPPTPAPQTNPPQTGPDAPPPAEGESAESLGAPTPDPVPTLQAEAQPRAPGESDSRLLAQQYYDPRDPMPNYDVLANLQAKGTPSDDLAAALEGVLHNDPPAREPHPELSADIATAQQTTLDPVLIFSGSYEVTVTDCEIASVGMPLRLTRSYRSGIVYFGPWGYNWDHNYNVYLRPLNDGGVAVWTGQLREEIYEPGEDGSYSPPTGVFRKLELLPGLSPHAQEEYRLTEPNGRALLFSTPPGWPLADRVPLTAIVDRHGNEHTLGYDAHGRLSRVCDADGRFIAFEYGNCGLLERVADHSERAWSYAHDEEVAHLVAVVTPATEQHPAGATTRYEYDRFQEHPGLAHNIVRVIDPLGRTVVENEYGTDGSVEDWNRVVRQTFGGFTAEYSAERLQYVPSDPEAINVPALRVEAIDPGVLHVLTFNYRGDLLDERFRLVRDGSYRLVATISRYDPQGNLASRYEPDGHGYLYTHDYENPDPRARGNLMRVEEVASPLAPVGSRVPLRATYEPKYNLPKTLLDAMGELTTWFYDYETNPAGTGLATELRRPQVTRPDGSRHRTVERFSYNARGQLERHEVGPVTHSFEYDTAALTAGYLIRRTHTTPSTTFVERYEHDTIGNTVARIDGLGNRTVYTVDATPRVVRVDTPDGASWFFEYDLCGALAQIREPAGGYRDGTLTDPFIEHHFKFDELGHMTAQIIAANTVEPRAYSCRYTAEGALLAATDAIGRVLRREIDERGQTLREELYGGAGELAYRRLLGYSLSGQLASVRLEGGPATTFDYDGFSEPRKVTLPDSTTVSYIHDKRGLLTAVEARAAATAGGSLLAQREWELDERGMIRAQIDYLFGPGITPATLLSKFWLDDEGLPITIEGPSELTLQREYSALRVLVSESDSLGNSATWTLDGAGNATALQLVEQGAPGAAKSLTWLSSYDERGRLITAADPLANSVAYVYDARGKLVQSVNPLGESLEIAYNAHGEVVGVTASSATASGVAMTFERDAAGRVSSATDPAGTSTHMTVDAQDRVSSVERADGRRQYRAYDDLTDGLHELIDFDGTVIAFANNPLGLPVRIEATPVAGVAATPTIELAYDGLRRIVEARTGSIVHAFEYDSLGRLLSDAGPDTVVFAHDPADRWRRVTYPDGRVDRYDYDQLSRLTAITHEVEGAIPLRSAGLPPGSTIAAWTWAGLTRLGSCMAGAGAMTEYGYDGAGRLASLEAGGGSARALSQRLLRDPRGLVGAELRDAADGRSYEHDPRSRLTVARYGLDLAGVAGLAPGSTPIASLSQPELDAAIAAAGASLPGPLSVQLSFTPQDTIAERIDRDASGSAVAVAQFTTDPLLNRIVAKDEAQIAYDDAGNVIDDGTRQFTYDAFRRLVEVRSAGTLLERRTYDGLGRLHARATSTETRYAYAADEVLQITTVGAGATQFVVSPALDRPVLASLAGGSYLLLSDHAGSLVGATDLAGEALELYTYDLYGQPLVLAPDGTARQRSALGITPRFLGRPWCEEVGLYDFRNRAYHPDLFVFLQPDPLPFSSSWSPYLFVAGDPLDFADPFGTVIMLLPILAGAVTGALIGGVGAWMSGGEAKDIAFAAGAGALGGAFAGAGAPALGAMVAGGLMGAWSGGCVGARMGGVEGAVIGAIGGGLAGAALGAAGGYMGARIGNVVGTSASGLIYRQLVTRTTMATATAAGRYGGTALGGYVGGTSASLITNTTATLGIDIVTGRQVTADQLLDGARHSLTIDGPLSLVGAPLERSGMIYELPGNRANALGAEGELLVGRSIGVDPANGSERITINGRQRRPDFPSDETIARWNEIVEVKNKARLSASDIRQIGDFDTLAQSQGATLKAYERPGAGLSAQVPGLNNVRWLSIPQHPLVVTVPTSELQVLAKSEK
jgi:RHS repeat-associated protein